MAEETRVLKYPDASERELRIVGLRIVVLKGPDKGRALKIEREEIVVGTATSADLCLTDPAVSRNHLSLRVTERGCLVTDLESRNGTRFDGHELVALYLVPGDVLELGSTRLRIESTRDGVRLPVSDAPSFGRLLGQSVAARRMFAILQQIAGTDATVLLGGETGSGKDAVAETLHDASARSTRPFVVFDCSTAHAGLIEAALFGHAQGAFTGAIRSNAGVFEEAEGGTLFLDEIGELPRELQPKLLRALEKREVRRLGEQQVRPVNVRIIAATNRDLKADVNRGLFREDLFYRLNVVAIRVPPLRERPEDIPLLATYFWRQLTRDPQAQLAEEALATFVLHRWPGNIRELRNRVERLLATSDAAITGVTGTHETYKAAKAAAVEVFERSYLGALMIRASGNVSEAARLAEVDRTHLGKLLRLYGVARPPRT